MVYTSSYPPVDIPEGDVYTEILGSLTAEDLDRIAVTDGVTELTYGSLKAQADAFAGALAARGIDQGDVVALQAPNTPAFVIAFFGILRAGATVTTLNPLYSPNEIAKQLGDSRAKAYVTTAMLLPSARAAALEAGLTAGDIIVLDDAEGHDCLADLLGQDLPAPAVSIHPATALAALPYSSGTTGMAKGVMLTHRNLVANIVQGAAALDVAPDDKVMAVLPFSHIYGMNTIMNLTLYRRGTLTTLAKMDLPAFLGLIQSQRVTYLYIAPPLAVALVKHPMVDDYDLSSVRQILTAAAPMDEALGKALLARLPARFVQGFGMTELSPISHITPMSDDSVSIGSVGLALPNIEFKVIDIETGEEVPEVPGGRTAAGEMLVRGPNVMLGYLGNSVATAATITPDGWLHTGDIVEVGPHQEVYVVDRLKELIKYKGHQVPPAELEALLLTHPAIADAAVVAHPDEEAGEIPRAFIVLQDGARATGEDIIEWTRERIAPHKRIRMVDFIDAIPKSAAGKILRKDLRSTRAPRP
ncbi:AMP-binding protein [Streptomyces hydrogenans]|uniref:AMP-binding protein n=1 Tax=Streptomyces hydrogenans TaxID=1873719 RepID=UPI0037F84F29